MRVIYIAPKNIKQTHMRSHCTMAKRMTSILRHVAEAFPPARQGTILNSSFVHRHTLSPYVKQRLTFQQMFAYGRLLETVTTHKAGSRYVHKPWARESNI